MGKDKNATASNPLLIQPILQKVFGYFSFWNQKKCRLVCYFWKEELNGILRKRSKINLQNLIFTKESSIQRHLSSDEIDNLSQICTSFVLDTDNKEKVQIILKFMTNFNNCLSVKYLELRNFAWSLQFVQRKLLCNFPNLQELRLPIMQIEQHNKKINSIITANNKISTAKIFTEDEMLTFPNIKSIIITLEIRDLGNFKMSQFMTINPLLSLFNSCPNVQNIVYPNLIQFTSPFENPARCLMSTIINSTTNNNFHHLSTLVIDTFLNNQDLELMTSKCFPLRKLQMTTTPEITCDILYSFLKSIECTLTSLTLTLRDRFNLEGETFPHMKYLENISIIAWNGYLHFLNKCQKNHITTKLKLLVVVLIEMTEEELPTNEFLVWYRDQLPLKTLELHGVKQVSNKKIVQKLLLMNFWNLTSLTMDSVDDSYLQIIYQALPYLQEFIILYGEFTDVGITGIPKRGVVSEDIYHEENYINGLKRYSGINDLKNLRKLILTGEISDFSVLFGISKCKALTHLELIGRHCTKVTDKSLIRIADYMKELTYIRIRNFHEVTQYGIQYIYKQFRGREIYVGD